MPNYNLAQLNIAVLKAPLDSPILADFVANLDRINALAENSPGYIWRLKSEDGNATSFHPLGEDTIVNLSIWQDVETLREYVYKSAHVDIMRRRKEWFESMSEAYMVLWWVLEGHRPTIEEALSRLKELRENASTPKAFTFRTLFPRPTSDLK